MRTMWLALAWLSASLATAYSLTGHHDRATEEWASGAFWGVMAVVATKARER